MTVSLTSSIVIPVSIIDDDQTEDIEQFTIEACHTVKNICIQTIVTVIDNDG